MLQGKLGTSLWWWQKDHWKVKCVVLLLRPIETDLFFTCLLIFVAVISVHLYSSLSPGVSCVFFLWSFPTALSVSHAFSSLLVSQSYSSLGSSLSLWMGRVKHLLSWFRAVYSADCSGGRVTACFVSPLNCCGSSSASFTVSQLDLKKKKLCNFHIFTMSTYY